MTCFKIYPVYGFPGGAKPTKIKNKLV